MSPLPLRLLLPALVLVACKQPDPPAITAPWTDTFDRAEIGPDWLATGDGYALREGRLTAQGAHNHPIWLRKRLPRDVVIELDCASASPDGDLKIEVFGDGHSYDPDQGRYMASGYVLIMGGWKNSRSIIARQDEHAPGIPTRAAPKVEPDRTYHWKIVRKGNRLDWFVDDPSTPFLSLDDPEPLEGKGHEYFAIDDWEAPLRFDNLSIAPAP